ncbi:hypothetical protein [Thalassotalea sp. ND16A]|uniref:hypothetical protein n=1 Tax=Thalassotalea sp. ND16A TaxID=1535422 RepID=UPI00051A4A9A|nr:hypothetical protein [Thalassotalea sp. ND16A]KGJ98457.1 hypothetical protein ND16A_0646 [Thalassotalea sp. ND16A]
MEAKSFVIGITGHRDIDTNTAEHLMTAVHLFLDELKLLLPNTPLEVVTGMADGADRILAKVALAKNIKVNAVLPMAEEIYRADFSADSWDEYQTLLSSGNVAVKTLITDAVDMVKAQQQGPERDALYHSLAKYINEQSNIVIAVWDGVNPGLKGGTADVVLSYLQAKNIADKISKQAVNYINGDEQAIYGTNSVYWLPVASGSKNHHQIELSSFKPSYLSGMQGPYTIKTHAAMPESVCAQMRDLDDYNRQCLHLEQQNLISRQYSLLTNYNMDETNDQSATLKHLDEEFLKADAVALANQKRSDGQFKLFSLMAAAMGLLFLVYAKITASKILLIGYLLLFALGWYLFKGSTKNKWFTRHLTARVLAETLRTQFYLVLINKSNPVRTTKLMNMSGVSQFSGASWLKQVIMSQQSMLVPQEQSNSQQEYNMNFVCQHWLTEQAHYFQAKIRNLSAHHHKLEKIKSLLFSASAMATIVLILFKYQLVEIVLFAHVDAKIFTVLLMGLLPFWLGVWEIYQNKMAVKELLWQYRNQSMVFNQAQQQIEHASTLKQKAEVLSHLAERSIMENYIWIIHRYHREHEPPTAG